MITSQDVIVT